MQQPRTRKRSSGYSGFRLWAWLLALLLPLGVQAGDSPAPVSNAEGGSRVVAVAAGWHSCALSADASVACWGRNDYGAAPPTRAGAYIALSAGLLHSCALKVDGSVECWGLNTDGQAPASREGTYTALATGGSHTCGLKAVGSVECWGSDAAGQAPAMLAGPYASLAAGDSHTCGLKADGSVECWGYNSEGAAPASREGPYTALAAGGSYTCGLKSDGLVECWGRTWGTPGGPYTALAAGFQHSCGLKADGVVECWGSNSFGQAPATRVGPYIALAAGLLHTCGLRAEGGVDCWGAGGPGTSGSNDYGQSTVPAAMQLNGASGFGQMAAGNAHACQVGPNGTLGCWGDNFQGQATAPAGTFTQVALGTTHSCALDDAGQVTCWGEGSAVNQATFGTFAYKSLALSDSGRTCAQRADLDLIVCNGGDLPQIPAAWPDARLKQFSMGGADFCGVHVDGQGHCLGPLATHVFAAHDFTRIEVGLDSYCVLRKEGFLYCNGFNAAFDTGTEPAGDFRAISVGWNHACAIRDTGTLACWGSNLNGQATPPAGTFVQVAAGNTFTCAIRGDGVRLCWGDDAHGQAPQLALSPASVADGVLGIAHAGANFALADAGPNADGDYVPPSPAFAVVDGALPPGLTLSAAGAVGGTPTAAGIYSFTVEGEDANGFVATRAYTVNIIADSTPPAIAYTFTPPVPDGGNGWYVSDVGIAWSVTDAQSAVTFSTGCNPVTLATDTLGATWTCTATSAGGSASLTTATIRRDATAPTLAPTLPSPLLRGGSYSASPNASDATSGVASATCGALDTSTVGSKSTTCTAIDNAGNRLSVALAYTVTTSCASEGYAGTQLIWCRNICEMGYTGSTLNMWIRRWISRYRTPPYCLAQPTAY